MSPGKSESVRRVLIYRLGSLGDTVIALPALHLVRRAFPDAERRMLTSFPPQSKAPASSAVLEGTGLVHGYMRYSYGTRSLYDLFNLWWQLVKWRPEVLVYMNGERTLAAVRRDVQFFRLCGIRRIVGAPKTREMEHGVKRAPQTESVESGLTLFEPECARLTRNLESLGLIQLDDPSNWDLALTQKERMRAAEALASLNGRPFLAMSLGTKNQSNDWTVANWSALARRMAKLYPTHAIAICGASAEREASDIVATAWREMGTSQALNLCGLLSPRESAVVFEGADAFLGHDSGPVHLASAVQTPCIAIYGSRNMPGLWFPYGKHHRVIYHQVECAGCKLEECVIQRKKCILGISVDEVLSALAMTLGAIV